MKAKILILVAAGLTVVFICFYSQPRLSRREEKQTPANQSSAQPRLLRANSPSRGEAHQFPELPALPPNPSIPESIRPIYGMEGEDFFGRLEAVKRLGNSLKEEERQALIDFLRTYQEEGVRERRGVLKNDIILVLKKQLRFPADLEGTLMEIFQDPQQDPVVRDYALQHLSTMYERATAKDTIKQLLWDGLNEVETSIAGSALLALERWHGLGAGIEQSQLELAALQLARNQNASELSRITAIQVCAHLKLKEVLSTVVSLVQSKTSLPLQISAVAALGELGGADNRQILETLSLSAGARIQPAAQLALRRLNQHLGQTN